MNSLAMSAHDVVGHICKLGTAAITPPQTDAPEELIYPPCPNPSCTYFESSGTVGPSGVGGIFYCYECGETFN